MEAQPQGHVQQVHQQNQQPQVPLQQVPVLKCQWATQLLPNNLKFCSINLKCQQTLWPLPNKLKLARYSVQVLCFILRRSAL